MANKQRQPQKDAKIGLESGLNRLAGLINGRSPRSLVNRLNSRRIRAVVPHAKRIAVAEAIAARAQAALESVQEHGDDAEAEEERILIADL